MLFVLNTSRRNAATSIIKEE